MRNETEIIQYMNECEDVADRLLGICDDWTIQDIEEHLRWLIDNPDEIADGYNRVMFKYENIGEIMNWVRLSK